jgi:uncharacterized protein YecT (DUF1311 family)
MKVLHILVCALLGLTCSTIAAWAQEAKCPQGYSNDDCDRWYVERADKALSELVEKKIAERSRLSTRPDFPEAVKRTVTEAHRAWLSFREAECKAYVTASVMSARTERARYSSCLLRMTERRIAELN